MKTLEKGSIEKTPVFKKNSDIACWASENLILGQKLFILKFLTMPKTVAFLTAILLQNFKKN